MARIVVADSTGKQYEFGSDFVETDEKLFLLPHDALFRIEVPVMTLVPQTQAWLDEQKSKALSSSR